MNRRGTSGRKYRPFVWDPAYNRLSAGVAELGIRDALKLHWSSGRVGSNPTAGTIVDVVKQILSWAEARPGVVALALVGSVARGTQTGGSDIDFVVVSEGGRDSYSDLDWSAAFPEMKLLSGRNWGALREFRLLLPSGAEIDLGVVGPEWAATDPVDAGTLRVVQDGMEILYDPDGRLVSLAAACR